MDSAGQPVRAQHITALRTAIDEMRVRYGADPMVYPEEIVPGSVIRRLDIMTLRDALR